MLMVTKKMQIPRRIQDKNLEVRDMENCSNKNSDSMTLRKHTGKKLLWK